MPFKSRAQRRKFAQLLVEGKISDQTFEEWNRETGRRKLPERVAPKTRRRATRKTKGGEAGPSPPPTVVGGLGPDCTRLDADVCEPMGR